MAALSSPLSGHPKNVHFFSHLKVCTVRYGKSETKFQTTMLYRAECGKCSVNVVIPLTVPLEKLHYPVMNVLLFHLL